MIYFKIDITEDGICMAVYDEEKLLEELNDPDDREEYRFYRTIPKNRWTENWNMGTIIIQGEVIVPQAVEKVKRYEL